MEDSDCSRPLVQNLTLVTILHPSELEDFIKCISHLGFLPYPNSQYKILNLILCVWERERDMSVVYFKDSAILWIVFTEFTVFSECNCVFECVFWLVNGILYSCMYNWYKILSKVVTPLISICLFLFDLLRSLKIKSIFEFWSLKIKTVDYIAECSLMFL